MKIRILAIGATTAATLDAATTGQADDDHLGTVRFPISCGAVQAKFDRAVALLHNFFYPETVKAFQAVIQEDPGCVIAYWGLALSEALARFGKPDIFNTDQGAQFTSDEFTKMLTDHGIEISMDGRGRCHDNIFVERLWWTVKRLTASNRSAVSASSSTGIICGVRIRRSAGEHRTRLTSANRPLRRHWPPDAMPSRGCEFVDSRLRRSPHDRASAVPYWTSRGKRNAFPPTLPTGRRLPTSFTAPPNKTR